VTRAIAVIAVCASLSACSAMQGIGAGLSALGPSGPSVDATAQIGAENVAEGDAVVSNRSVEEREQRTETDAGVEVSEVSGVSNVQSTSDSSVSSTEKGTGAGVSLSDFSAESLQIDKVPGMYWLFLLLLFLSPGAPEIAKFINKIRRRKD